MKDAVLLGRVAGPHGVRGWVRVRYFGEGPGHLLGVERVALSRREDDPAPAEREVEESGPGRPGEVRMRLAGVRTREEAEALRGWFLSGPRAALEALPPGEHYWFELVGCRAELPDGRTLGTVRELWATGAHDVLVVEGEKGRRHLIPAADAFLAEVDVAAKRIRIQPIPGLLEGEEAEPDGAGPRGQRGGEA
jgi:16S rRNA processing protein RimM